MYTGICLEMHLIFRHTLTKGVGLMKAYDTINDILVYLFNEIWDLEENAIITDEFKDITINDMHIIEAIGMGDGNNMSTIAKKLNITVGSLTTSVSALVSKKYVFRERSEEDRRLVIIKLTPKGENAFKKHENFHHKMTDAVINSLDEEQIPVLTETLSNLAEFFRKFKGK